MMINPEDTEKKFLLAVNVREDTNENCVDEEEPPIPATIVRVTGNDNIYFSTTDSNGTSSFELAAALYTTTLEADTIFWENCTDSQTASLSEDASYLEQNFLLQPQIPCPQLSAQINLANLRPCFDDTNTATVTVCNTSNLAVQDATVQISFPEAVAGYVASLQDLQGTPLEDWELTFGEIAPGECIQQKFQLVLECDTPLNLEICLMTLLTTNYECDGISVPVPGNELCLLTIASYDPNNKLAQPVGQGTDRILPPDTPLDYTINFQNTGTDTAFLVVIRDTLPAELAGGTLQPGTSSHNYELSVENDRILTFTFPRILLPDSNVNVIGSQGYVRYSIEMTPGLALGTVIENRAAIYFDFNEPIFTEYAFHTLGIPTSTDGLALPSTTGIRIYPNPTTQFFTIGQTGTITTESISYQLFDVAGRMVQQGLVSEANSTVSTNYLSPGVYFIHCESQGISLGRAKLIKQ
jgi:uncharacterized repeat protein (TIGR01451 family)